MSSGDAYFNILLMLASNAIAITGSSMVARYQARYAQKLTASNNAEQAGAPANKKEREEHLEPSGKAKTIISAIDVIALLIDSWFLWMLINDPTGPTRQDIFWITFYTIITFYWANRVLNDILGDSVIDQIRHQKRADMSMFGLVKDLSEDHIKLRDKVKEIETKEKPKLAAKRSKSRSAK